MKTYRWSLLALALAVFWVIVGLVGDSGTVEDTEITVSLTTETTTGNTPSTVANPSPTTPDQAPTDPEARSTTTVVAPARFSDLPTIAPRELPIEALDTLDRIAAGGPFPFRQDDSTFQNREGILPNRPTGHYREYTVITPGEGDRGARRIVAGSDGELYYTDDHYDSFREIVRDGP